MLHSLDYTLLPWSVPLALTCCTPWLNSASQVSPLGFDMLNSLTTLCFPGQSPWLWHAELPDYTLLPWSVPLALTCCTPWLQCNLLPWSVPLALTCCTPWLHSASQVSPLGVDMLHSLTTLCFPGQSPWLWHAELPDYTLLPWSVPLALTCCTPWLHSASQVSPLGVDMLHSLTTLCFPGQSPWLWHAELPDYTLLPRSVPLALTCWTPWLHSASLVSPLGFDMLHSLTTLCFPGQSPWRWHAALPNYTLLPWSVALALTCCTPWLHSASLVSPIGFDMLHSLTTLSFPGQSPWRWHAALPDYTLLPRSVPLALTCRTPWLHSASLVSPLGFDMLHSLTTLCFPGQSHWLWHAALPDYTQLPRSVPLALTCRTPWLHSASLVSPLGFDMLHSLTTLCFPGQSPWLWHAALPDYTLLPRSVPLALSRHATLPDYTLLPCSVPLALTCCTPWLHSASLVRPLGFDLLNSLTTLCFPGQSSWLWHAALPDYTLLPWSGPLALTCWTPWLHSASQVSLLGFDMMHSLTTLCFPGQSSWLWHAALPDYTLLPWSGPLALTCWTPWLHSASQVSPLGFDMLNSLTTLCFPGQSRRLWHAALPDYTLLPRSVPLALTCCTPWLHSASQVSPLGFDMMHSLTTLCFPGQSSWLWHAELPDYTLLPWSVLLALTCWTPWLHSASLVSPLGFDMLHSLTTLCFPGQSSCLWHAALPDYTLLPRFVFCWWYTANMISKKHFSICPVLLFFWLVTFVDVPGSAQTVRIYGFDWQCSNVYVQIFWMLSLDIYCAT